VDVRSTRPLVVILSALALLAAACSGGEEDAAGVDPTLPDVDPPGVVETATPDEATATSTPDADSPTATPDAPTSAPEPSPAEPDLADLQLGLREIATLDAPIAMALRPGDDTLYVAERAGRVRPLQVDGTVGSPLIDISDRTDTGSERGLLGIAWSVDGDRLFLSSTGPGGETRLDAVDVVDGSLDDSTTTTLLEVPQPASNHNGGNLLMGPDGHLYLGLGDGGGANDQFAQGQRPDTLLGAMLRITPTADGYDIPADNPFADGVGGAPEVWAYGLRNPWRFSFDAATGDLWIADVGQNAVEEVNRVPLDAAGLNYGWPRFEGDRPFDGQAADGPVVDPVVTYEHSRGCSVTGGYVYRGQAIPGLQGAYLYTDFCSGEIWAADVAPDGTLRDDVDTGLSLANPVSFGEGPDGELYVLSLNGPIALIERG
jgi:glucose/arabinose dehydrogenase